MVYDPLLTPERLAKIRNGKLREDVATLAPSLRLTRRSVEGAPKPRRDALSVNPLEISRRYSAAVARLYRILQGVGRANNIIAAVDGAEHAALARRGMRLISNYMLRTAPPPPNGRPDPNPFRSMSDRDAARKFIRMVEDLADASTGVLGSWYTK